MFYIVNIILIVIIIIMMVQKKMASFGTMVHEWEGEPGVPNNFAY